MNTYTLVALGSAVAAFVIIKITKGTSDVQVDEQAGTRQKQATQKTEANASKG